MTLSYCQVRVPMYEYKYISHYWTVKQYYLSGHKLHFNIFFLNLVQLCLQTSSTALDSYFVYCPKIHKNTKYTVHQVEGG